MSEAFSPFPALAGGALIGLAAVLLMAAVGRIAGISGIVARLLPPYADDGFAGRAAFVLGLVAAPILAGLAGAEFAAPAIAANLPVLVLAGLLVGFGTVWGNGCTSGHGVCGLSRLSVRSLVATATFMAAAMATVYLVRHIL
jgi:uncharacterized membrane protein YedE/YeeE